MSRLVSVVGSRSLPRVFYPAVSSVVSHFASRGWSVGSGGALGADHMVLSAILSSGMVSQGVVFAPWSSFTGFPRAVVPSICRLSAFGGQVIWGSAAPGSSREEVLSAIFARSRRLVSSSSLVVAFLFGPSRGTLFTVREAVSRGVPVVVFLCGGGALLPPALRSKCRVYEYGEEQMSRSEMGECVSALVTAGSV